MFKKIGYSMVAVLATVILTAGLLVGCDSGSKTIKIPYVQWACAEAESHMAQYLLEEMGYEVELSTVQAGVMWTSVATGDADVFTTAWLPYTHASYWEEYGDDVEKLGVLFDQAVLALVVPSYVTIDSIAEMKDHKAEFQGRIVGIDPGAGIMEATRNTLMPAYDLDDWNLMESSEAGMISELERAINRGEWIAVTGWAPHWKFFAYDLKILEDPELSYGGMEEIVIIGRDGFTEDFPDAAEFFSKWTITADQLGEVMYMINIDKMDPAEAASTWIEDNRDIVNTWLP
ncbi:MAG TPA: glycine/betaine ABC transporter [Dehalococcoidia bacterium]|jgi:glycine betaine/proline transport system substrate-binding protein|nr:glycine/betaine ABC transporter [Dehalococcoidia bacterium]